MLSFEGYPQWASRSQADTAEWLKQCAIAHNARINNLQYAFVDDTRIVEINHQYLQHDYPTDIISFGYSEGELIEGEIYISLDTVESNAKDLSLERGDELDRVMVHGLLHFIGFGDADEDEKARMREEENKCLILRPKNLSKK